MLSFGSQIRVPYIYVHVYYTLLIAFRFVIQFSMAMYNTYKYVCVPAHANRMINILYMQSGTIIYNYIQFAMVIYAMYTNGSE